MSPLKFGTRVGQVLMSHQVELEIWANCMHAQKLNKLELGNSINRRLHFLNKAIIKLSVYQIPCLTQVRRGTEKEIPLSRILEADK